jgi:hypothetical protein
MPVPYARPDFSASTEDNDREFDALGAAEVRAPTRDAPSTFRNIKITEFPTHSIEPS